MKTYRVRIKGTINDVIEVEVEDNVTDETAIREAALNSWRYVEYEDLSADEVEGEVL